MTTTLRDALARCVEALQWHAEHGKGYPDITRRRDQKALRYAKAVMEKSPPDLRPLVMLADQYARAAVREERAGIYDRVSSMDVRDKFITALEAALKEEKR